MAKGNEMIWFDVDVFKDALDAAIGEAEKAVKLAIRSTMGKVRGHATSKMSSLIREKWNIKKKYLDQRILVRVGNRGGDYESFEMMIKGTSISLAYFGAVERKGTIRTLGVGGSRKMKNRSRAQGVSVEVFRGNKETLPGAWMEYVPSWGLTVRRREGRGRNTARIQKVISPASMFNDAKTADRFEESVMDYLERTFEHELAWRLSQAGLG